MDERQEEIIKEFEGLNDWFMKYEKLISFGKELKSDESLKEEENLISGCQSDVWVRVERKGDRIKIYADSDAMITRGIIALILRALNERSKEDILDTKLYFIDRIGLSSNLSPARNNGLKSVVSEIKSRIKEV